MDVHLADVPLAQVASYIDATFGPLAAEKSLAFDVRVAPGAPEAVHTDEHRLQQVLRNLVSNAVKFTDSGRVSLTIEPAPDRDGFVAFTVGDTGIGIAADKQRVIFEAFQQADGTTSRRYGGTGLGLSISREIAHLLGGEIQVSSTPGEGSRFTLLVPVHLDPPAPPAGQDQPAAGAATPSRTAGDGSPAIPAPSTPSDDVLPYVSAAELLGESDIVDDRDDLQQGDRVLLVAVSDPATAGLGVTEARRRGFKALVTVDADRAINALRELGPDALVVGSDLVTSGGTSLLEAVKRTPATRHVPVHVVDMQPTPTGESRRKAMQAGAFAVIDSPVTEESLAEGLAEMASFLDRQVRRLLVVEDDDTERAAIIELIGTGDGVEAVGVAGADEAVAALDQGRFDAMVLDLKLSGTSGFTLLERLKKRGDLDALPVIVYTGKELTRREETRLRRYAETIIVKDARSPERLLDETALFLHRVEAQMPAERRRMIEHLRDDDAVFHGKRILIVDDDVRNVFALTSALERHGMSVTYAENGREGIERLESDGAVDLVLMDIMMPEMDGYATTEAIRAMGRYAKLPIIALTAKAMKGDREKSIAAGASDYVTKPVDVDQLLSLMRVWLYG